MTGFRSGLGYDSHRFAEGRKLILGGVEIAEAERGLIGHSDADVLAHAVTDAVLGAAGLGDIGRHFPDTDERWKDADSIGLLREAVRLAGGEGWAVENVDATVICEAPKLGPYRGEMESTLAAVLGGAGVNVKFTTNETMGFVGRGEGIAALATAALTARQEG
jgi:2-C-methyl-D-erythritol 2,4-cyclodiphosphate synthase